MSKRNKNRPARIETPAEWSWELPVAEEFVRQLQPQINRYGYTLTIIGGVARDGHSSHDLDLLLKPLHAHPDYEGALSVFGGRESFEISENPYNNEGKYGDTSNGTVAEIRLEDGHIIDLFFPGQVAVAVPELAAA